MQAQHNNYFLVINLIYWYNYSRVVGLNRSQQTTFQHDSSIFTTNQRVT